MQNLDPGQIKPQIEKKKLKMIENWKLTATGLNSRLTSSSESQLQMVWGAGLAKSRLCPPGSLVTQLGKLKNRQIVVQEDYLAHIAAPLRGWTSTAPGETGALVARLQGFGDLLWLCLVAEALGDGSKDVHQLVQICADSRVDHFCRSRGRPEL